MSILLVVDDEPDVQLLMRQKFRKQIKSDEYEFVFAANGVEAIEQLEKNKDIDVVLCDVNMPMMDGITLLTKTREINPTAQTIIVSAYGDMRNIRRAMNHGAFDFVTKPINFNDLGSTIERTIKHVKKLKESIAEKERLYTELEQYNRTLEQRVEERTKEIEERTREIIHQKEIIEAKNQSITESINYAKRIQNAILPTHEEILNSIPKSFILFEPRDIVSGDFYWLTTKNKKTILAALDCTGHGVPGAFMSLIGNDLLNLIVKANGITEPDEILNLLNENIIKVLRQSQNNSRDGMDVAICVIDYEKNVVEYAGAKNPLIYMQNGEMNIIKGDKKSIGGIEHHDTKFTKHTIAVTSDTVFYVFSDGFQDQFGEEGMKFMSKNFRNLLFEIHQEPLPEQKKKLQESFLTWKGKRPQVDDILIIGFQV